MRRYAGYLCFGLYLKFWKFRLGWTSDVIGQEECPYMRRHILWLVFFTLRFHKFLRSDPDEALHDHPWWFVTFPLGTYYEWKELLFRHRVKEEVSGFRFHFRPAGYRHAVVVDNPVWTIVLTGWVQRVWGFWNWEGGFVPYKEWFRRPPAPCEEPGIGIPYGNQEGPKPGKDKA